MNKGFSAAAILLLCGSVCVAQPIGMFTGQASVGDDNGAGLAEYDEAADAYEIEGSGNDIWGVPDGFYWIYLEVTGDFTATCAVEWLTGVDEGDRWKKAGIIARNTADDPTRADGEYACSSLNIGNLSNFFTRIEDGSETDVFTDDEEDLTPFTNTIQLIRNGNVFSMTRQLAAGGFQTLGTNTIPMEETVVVGLCVTSHNTGIIEAARFTDVSIEQGAGVGAFELY